jgi:hypothetical protein
MEQSRSCEANLFATSQEISRILWNPKVHYRVYKQWRNHDLEGGGVQQIQLRTQGSENGALGAVAT